MPAAKKHPSTRARANTASTAATLSGGGVAIVPGLPKRPPLKHDVDGVMVVEAQEWNESTLEWWADLWASPMAKEYHSSDKHALFLLAVLVDDFWSNPSTKLASEIRLQRVAFGLTPYDRRRLEWTIETTEDAKDRGSKRRGGQSSPTPQQGNDPRLALVQ